MGQILILSQKNNVKSDVLTDERVCCFQTWTVTKTCIKEHLHFSIDLLYRVSPLDLNILKANETISDGIQVNTVTSGTFGSSCSSVCLSGLG